MHTWTEEQLSSMEEKAVKEGHPFTSLSRPWYTSAYNTYGLPEDLTFLGVVGYVDAEPIKKRSKYESSKWVAVQQGEFLRVVPELYLRAVLVKKGEPLTDDDLPFWDKSGKVQVTTAKGEVKFPGRRSESLFGIPSRAPEYSRLYREKNKDRMKRASKKFQQKQRALLRAAKSGKSQSQEPTSMAELFAQRMGSTVEEVLGTSSTSILETPVSVPPVEEVKEFTLCPRCGSDIPVGGACEWCQWPK